MHSHLLQRGSMMVTKNFLRAVLLSSMLGLTLLGERSPEKKEMADFVIVGVGASGALIARKLTDDFRTSVIALEAGGNHDEDEPIKNSAFAPSLEASYPAEYFWLNATAVQACANGQSINWLSGRLLGGGSSINGEQYVRNSTPNFQEWEKLVGPEWGPQSALDHYKALENYNGCQKKCTDDRFSPSTFEPHGTHGLLNIRQVPETPSQAAIKLAKAIECSTGFKKIKDYNSPCSEIGSFTQWQLFQNPDGTRASSSVCFLDKSVVTKKGHGVNGRKLKILTKATALRIIWQQNKAVGVEYLHEGYYKKVFAKKKVVLCAGNLNSHLLMNSGVGSAEELKKLGIPVVYDNPNVGRHYRNHHILTFLFSMNSCDADEFQNGDPNAIYTGGAFLPNAQGPYDRRQFELVGVPVLSDGSALFSESRIGYVGKNALKESSRSKS